MLNLSIIDLRAISYYAARVSNPEIAQQKIATWADIFWLMGQERVTSTKTSARAGGGLVQHGMQQCRRMMKLEGQTPDALWVLCYSIFPKDCVTSEEERLLFGS